MYNDPKENAKNRIGQSIVTLYFIVNIAVIVYLAWSGFTQPNDYSVLIPSIGVFVLAKLMEHYLPNKLLDGSFFDEDETWSSFLFFIVAHGIFRSMHAGIVFFLGVFGAQLF